MGFEDFSGCWKFQSGIDGSLGIITGQEGDAIERVLWDLGHIGNIVYFFQWCEEIVKSLLMCKWFEAIAVVKAWQGRDRELFILLGKMGPLKMKSTF